MNPYHLATMNPYLFCNYKPLSLLLLQTLTSLTTMNPHLSHYYEPLPLSLLQTLTSLTTMNPYHLLANPPHLSIVNPYLFHYYEPSPCHSYNCLSMNMKLMLRCCPLSLIYILLYTIRYLYSNIFTDHETLPYIQTLTSFTTMIPHHLPIVNPYLSCYCKSSSLWLL